VEPQSSGTGNARASFAARRGALDERSGRTARERAALRIGWAAGLMALAWFITGAFGFGTRAAFLYQIDYAHPLSTYPYGYFMGEQRTLFGLARREPAWAATVAAIVLNPLWFVMWRRTALPAGRGIGVVWSLSVTAAVIALGASRKVAPGMELHGSWPSLTAAGVFLALAFVVAPRAVRRANEDEVDAFTLRRLLRKQRERA
jgi:hypothetical protein